jgi:hypothetical protein
MAKAKKKAPTLAPKKKKTKLAAQPVKKIKSNDKAKPKAKKKRASRPPKTKTNTIDSHPDNSGILAIPKHLPDFIKTNITHFNKNRK